MGRVTDWLLAYVMTTGAFAKLVATLGAFVAAVEFPRAWLVADDVCVSCTKRYISRSLFYRRP